MKKSNNLDFVFLAALPFLAGLVFFVVYVGGYIPGVPVPSWHVPWASTLDHIRVVASQNETAAIAVAVAIVAGIVGCTWAVMVLFDLKKGAVALVRWMLRRPPRLVSGILRPDYESTWSVEMGTINEEQKLYRVKRKPWTTEGTTSHAGH
jgi:hypothetical protein